MNRRAVRLASCFILALALFRPDPSPAMAQHGGHGGSHHGHSGHGGGGGGGGGVIIGGPVIPVPVPIPFGVPIAVPVGFGRPVGGGLLLPQPGPPILQARPREVMPAARPKTDPAKADGLVTVGDRLFRAGNTRRAEERYQQAIRANPGTALPYLRLAQIDISRGDYKMAADSLRDAMKAEPGWMLNARDIQAMYAEPADFAKAVARMESHLQANPGDRDAWLVLGAEYYLSGKTRQASDVFSRLGDRKPDPTLAAFLDATTPDALTP